MIFFILYSVVFILIGVFFLLYVFRKKVTLNTLLLDPDEKIVFEEKPASLQWMFGENNGRYRRRPVIQITNKRIIFAEKKLIKDDARIVTVFVFDAGQELKQNHLKNGFFTFLFNQSGIKISQDAKGRNILDISTTPTYGAWVKNNTAPCMMRVMTDNINQYKNFLNRKTLSVHR